MRAMRHLPYVVLLAVAGCGDNAVSSHDLAMPPALMDMAVPDLAPTSTAARGEELVKHLLLCGSCHTTPDATGAPSANPADFLAGGRAFTVTTGDGGTATVYAANITPDVATGVGSWSTSNVQDAIVNGIDKDGLPLWPTMPYPRFGNLTANDAMSIALYLATVPARNHVVPPNTATPTLAALRLVFTSIPHTTLPSSDPKFASAENGRYLANLGCLHCHTVDGPAPVGFDVAKAYAGGRPMLDGAQLIRSSNLTPAATGLLGWSSGDLVLTLTSNHEKGGGRELCPPMPGGPSGVGGLFDSDLMDIANYVHTLPAVTNGPFACPDAGP